ncbi:TetR family transcriptional regulator [Leucobacter sp. GX24907]
MRNSRSDVVAAALRVLDEHGLEFCSMRRVAAELEVQPSALYHHVPNKQELLALMADEITRPVLSVVGADGAERAHELAGAESADRATAARELCRALRNAMLAVRDGADVVATASAYRLGASQVETELAALVGVEGARTLLLFTFGHAQSTQTQRQAIEFGALVGGAVAAGAAAEGEETDRLEASYERGLGIILAGLASLAAG